MQSTTQKTFAETLRETRLNLGLSQVAMARRIPLSRSTYEHYEYGKRKPDPFKETALRNRLKTLARKKCLPINREQPHCAASVVQNVVRSSDNQNEGANTK